MEIVYVCHSINNKNVRDGELVILRKNEAELYFEFGENEKNIKKRFYTDLETLRKDYKEVEEIKEKLDKQKKERNREDISSSEKAEKVEKKDSLKKSDLF